MTRVEPWLVSALFVGILALPVPAQEIMVGGGGAGESDGFGIQAGTVYVAVNKPGVMFGTMKRPGSAPEFAYLVLFKHRATDGAEVGNGSRSTCAGGDTMRATLAHDLEIHGKRFAFADDIALDPATNALKSETATIGGQPVDLREGRVFLVDFTGDKLIWKQVKAKLPTKLPNTIEIDGIRELVKRVRTELPRESKEVREFLK